MIKLLLILLPFTLQAQDTLRMLIPVADTSKAVPAAQWIKGYEVYEVYKFPLGDTATPGKLVATLGANKKPIGKPYVKTGVGIPPSGFLWADNWNDNALNPMDMASGLTIIGTSTMQGNPPPGWALVRTTQPMPAHVEFYINYLDNCNIGLTAAGTSLTVPVGTFGYCYDASGNKEYNGVFKYGVPYKTGYYVDMYYLNGSLSFKVNGVSQGVAFTNVPPGLYPTIGTSQKSIVTVKFDNFVYE